jgi:hypothetical protein
MPYGNALLLIVMTLASATSLAEGGHFQPLRLYGQPDLQGTWLHNDPTPLVRPGGYPAHISPQQAIAIEAMVFAALLDPNVPNDPVSDFTPRHISPIRGTLRSSIVTEPQDGLIPGTTLFKERIERNRFNLLNAMDGPEQRPTSERCLGNPASQPPILYNPGTNMHQIVQTQDTIVFFSEIMHDARIIRLNAKHAPAAVTSWLGDSVGWWEGDTLVVETKHFTVSDTGRSVPFVLYYVSPQTTVTERFTQISDNELNYVFTVDDPVYYTRPWSGETHFMRSTDRMFEYSCHEGNYSLPYILQGARERERLSQSEKQRASGEGAGD